MATSVSISATPSWLMVWRWPFAPSTGVRVQDVAIAGQPE